MKVEFCQGENEIIQAVNAWLLRVVSQYNAHSLFLPAGNSPKPVYRSWRESPLAEIKKLKLQQIDEIIDDPKAGDFARFFATELPAYQVQNLQKGQVEPKKIDLAFLGFGKNGHIGFHEPHLPTSFSYGIVDLSSTTKKTLGLEDTARGLSFGAAAFLDCQAICLLVSGPGKENAWKKFLAKDPAIPAVALQAHQDFTVIADADLRSSQE